MKEVKTPETENRRRHEGQTMKARIKRTGLSIRDFADYSTRRHSQTCKGMRF